jgi:hypothetical protein
MINPIYNISHDLAQIYLLDSKRFRGMYDNVYYTTNRRHIHTFTRSYIHLTEDRSLTLLSHTSIALVHKSRQGLNLGFQAGEYG